MAVVGCLGDITFITSLETFRTVDNMQWSGSSRIAVHERHNYHALTEYAGMDADELTFDMYLSAFLGMDPMAEIWRMFRYERDGRTLPMTIGEHVYGKYRWMIKSHKTKVHSYDGDGNITTCTVTVNLIEYLRK